MRILIILLLLTLVGCKSTKPKTIHKTVTETVTETVHDTVFEIQADSSFYQAYVRCVNNKPVITQPDVRPGQNLRAPKVHLKDSLLTVDCEVEAQKLFAEWKSKQVTRDTVTEIPVYIEKELTFFQKIQLWLGRIFLGIIVIATGYFLLKTYTKIGL